MEPSSWARGAAARVRRGAIAVALAACALAGCRDQAPLVPGQPVDDGKGPLPVVPPAPTVAADSGKVLLSAAAGAFGDTSGRVYVSVNVAARNITTQPISLDELCLLQLRAFGGTVAQGPIAWTMPPGRPDICPPLSDIHDAPPGIRFWFGSGFSSPLPLTAADGRTLPGGDYTFQALMRIGSDTVALPAGTLRLPAEVRPPLRDPRVLRYAVDTRLEGASPRQLVTRVGITNPTERNVYLEFGACSMVLRAYRTPERTGPPVWRSEAASPPGTDSPPGCLLYLAVRLLLPGASMLAPEHARRFLVEEILGDSLPEGRYYFTAELSFGGADPVRLPAGDALLTSEVTPLPAEADVGGLHYVAQTAPDASVPGSFRLTLTVSNPGNQRVLLVGSPSTTCPTQLVGFNSAERRDRWYLLRYADMTFAGCPLPLPPTTLAPGEARTFSATVTPPADARGRYWLTLFLWADQDPPAEPTPTRIVLAAGQATLGS